MKKFFMFLLFFSSTFLFSQERSSCTVNVTNPKEGDIWYVGKTYNITWTSSQYCPQYFVYVKLFGFKDGINYLIDTISNVKNDGSHPYTPKQSSTGYDYYYFNFYAEDKRGNAYVAGKSGKFYIKETVQDDFSLFPSNLSFLVEQGASSSQYFYIIPKKEVVYFNLSAEQEWISFEPSSGVAYLEQEPAKISVNVSSSGLAVGDYQGQITISSSTSDFYSTLNVFFTVVAPSTGTPKLELDKNKVYFNFKIGEEPPSYTVNLRNTGDGDAYFIIDRYSDILSISPLKGYLGPGKSIDLTVSLAKELNRVCTRKGFVRIKDQYGNAQYIYCWINAKSDSYNSLWEQSGIPSKIIPIAATGLSGGYGSFWSTDVSGVYMGTSFMQALQSIKEQKVFKSSSLRDKAYLIWGAVSKKSRSQEARITEFEITDEMPSSFVDFLGNFMGLSSTSSFIQVRGELANKIALYSRTFTTDEKGLTYGQFIDTPSEDQIIGISGGKEIVFGLRNDDSFRSNLFITELEGIETKVDVKLFNQNGEQIGNILTKTLEGFSQWQIIDIFNSAGSNNNWAYAEIISYGGGRIYGFGSVIDKRTNDPTTLPGVIPMGSRANDNLYIPAIVKAPGNYGTNWRTDLVFMNSSSNSLNVELEFYSKEGVTASQSYITLLPFSMGIYLDALKTLFGKDSGFGSVVVKNVNTSNFFVFSKIYNLKNDGSTYGQGTLAFKTEESTSVNDAPIFSMGLEESQKFRTNVGIFEISGNTAKVLFTLIFPEGESRNFSVDINPYQWIQIDSIIQRAGYDFYTSEVWVVASVINGSGKIVGYASLVDNNSSDAIFIKFKKP